MVEIDRSQLMPALAAATKAVLRRNTIPILGHIKIETASDKLVLTASNLDLQITVKAACKCAGGMSTTLPGMLLYDAVRKLPDAAVIKLTADEKTAELNSGRSRFRMQTLPATDFPDMAAEQVSSSFSLPAKTLDEICSKIAFAISTEETRYYLNGIHLHHDEGKLIAVATDGHRLAKTILGVEDDISNMPPVIVPRYFWQTIKGLFKDSEPVMVSLSPNKIIASQSDMTIVSKLIDATFPDYQRVIPEGAASSFSIDRQQLAAALDRVSTISSDRSRAIRFIFAENKLTLSSTDTERGEAQDQVDLANASTTDEVTIGFNGHYATDMLNACSGDLVTFHLNDASSPGKIKPVADEATVYVLMPMRL